MRKNLPTIVLALMLALLAVAYVSAQAITLEPPVPTTGTMEPPLQVTQFPTVEVTVGVTAQPTMETTAPPATAQPTAAPTTAAATPVMATPEMTGTPTDQSAYLRFANFAPNASGIDVYVNGSLTVQNLTYPSVSEWIAVDPGTQTLSFADEGQSPSSGAVAPVDVSASSGTWQTVAVIGSSSSLQTTVVPEDYSDLKPSTGGFTFVNAVEGSDPVNVVRGDAVYFAQIGYPSPNTSSSSSLVGDSAPST